MNTETRGLEKFWRRLQMAIGLGRIQTSTDDGNVQMVQVELQGGDVRDNTPRVSEYGFASRPLPGCQAVVIFVGGDRSNGAVIGTNDETHRMRDLQPGEVAIHDDQGQSVYITRAGIVIDGGGKPIQITNAPTVTADTPLFRSTGDVLDNCETNTVTIAQMREIYNAHTHTENNVTGGQTGGPSGDML